MPLSTKPPYDAELATALEAFPTLAMTSKDILTQYRDFTGQVYSAESILTDPEITHEEMTIPGPGGQMALSILRSRASAGGQRPAVFFIHGGGMIMGTRFLGIALTFDWIKQLDVVVLSLEYRLAPEHPNPAPVEDCYAGLKWVAEHASELGINRDKIMISGCSAGGGLTAGTALMARDRGGPKLFAQCLVCPMLDHRSSTVSSNQYLDEGTWPKNTNIAAWGWLLAGQKDVSIYASPSLATDLSGLPHAFIDVGAAEVFRDEDVAYASKLWECGVQAELHVWPGGWHGFDIFVPNATLSKSCQNARFDWIKRVLAETPPLSDGASSAP